MDSNVQVGHKQPALNVADQKNKGAFRRFADWHESHGCPRYSPDFNAALEARINNPDLTTEERFLPLVKRYAWGESSDYAVEPKTGRKLTLTDCANILGVDLSRVSRAARVYEATFEIEISQSGISPVIEPAKKKRKFAEASKSESDLFSLKSTRYGNDLQLSLFDKFAAEIWSSEYPEDAKAEAEAEAILQQIRSKKLHAYRKWKKDNSFPSNGKTCVGPQQSVAEARNKKLRRPATNGTPILISTVTTENLLYDSSSSSGRGTDDDEENRF